MLPWTCILNSGTFQFEQPVLAKSIFFVKQNNYKLFIRVFTNGLFSFENWHCWNLQLFNETLFRGWTEASSFVCSFCSLQSSYVLTRTHFLLPLWASAAVLSLTRQHRPRGAPGHVQAPSWHHSVLTLTEKYKYDTSNGIKFESTEKQLWVGLVLHPTARICFCAAPHLVSSMLLQLLVELQGDANHHFSFIPIGIGDVVQDAIEIYGRDEQEMNTWIIMSLTLSINNITLGITQQWLLAGLEDTTPSIMKPQYLQ